MAERSIITTDTKMRETLKYPQNTYPVQISAGLKLTSDMGYVSWHWHEAFELTYLVSGRLEFYINSDIFYLEAGEAIFINSEVLHQIKVIKGGEAIYYSYVFAPEFLCGSLQSFVAVKYILPMIHNRNFCYECFRHKRKWEEGLFKELAACNEAAKKGEDAGELEIMYRILGVVLKVIENTDVLSKEGHNRENKMYGSMMKLIFFIQEHYGEPITLEEISAAASLSKSSCSRIFKKMVKMTPFQYLLEFRINESKKMLLNSYFSTAQIAFLCGFHDSSYFCKMFKAYTGVTPTAFKRRNKGI